MPISVVWDTHLENTLYTHFSAQWTWEEFYSALDVEETLVSELGDTRYDGIIYFEGSYVPLSGNIIGNVVNGLKRRTGKKNFGATVICTRSSFHLMLLKTLIKVYPQVSGTLAAVSTMEQAYALVKQYRQASHAG